MHFYLSSMNLYKPTLDSSLSLVPSSPLQSSPYTLHTRPPGQQNNLPINPLTLLPRQKRHHPPYIPRHPRPPKRTNTRNPLTRHIHTHIRRPPGRIMPTILLKHIRHDPPRRNGIDRNPLGPRIRRERARKAFHSGFGTGVKRVVLHTGHCGGDGGGEDDAPAVGEVDEAGLGDEELGAAV